MSDIRKLIVQAIGVFAITFAAVFWVLNRAPVPYPAIHITAMKPDHRVPTFKPVETRLGQPEHLAEHQKEAAAEGDDDPRRTKYRMVLQEAIEAVEADHCAMEPKKLLGVAVTAYIGAKQADMPCAVCFWGRSEEDVMRAWSTPLDKALVERLHQLMLFGHLTREDFKEPPALFNLEPRKNFRNTC